MATKQQHLALVILLVSVSVLALQTPLSGLVHAQEQTQIVIINASGIAFLMEDGSSASATLTLTGTSQNDENEKLGDLSGTLQIGSITYNISNGQGEADRQGIIEIIADAGGDQNLTLHGTNRNGDLVFNFPESKLSSQYSLYLVGQLSSSSNSFSSPSSKSSFSSRSNSISSPNSQSSSNNSFTNQSSSEASFSITQKESENATMTQTVTSTKSTTQSATSAPPITQASNSTTVVTVTANVTVTVTTTSTVANTTITVHS